MGYKTIRILSLITLLMAAVFILLRFAGTVGFVRDLSGMELPIGMAFLFMSTLARTVGSILEAQSDEIAELRRQLAGSPSGS